MTSIVVGLDGSTAGEKALDHAKKLARLIGDCELTLVYVIEWTPYSFHTPQELEERHKRREHEIGRAEEVVLKPAADALAAEGLRTSSVVRHGDASVILDEIASEAGASLIVIGRTGQHGLRERLFGGVSGKLVGMATVPVTIVP